MAMKKMKWKMCWQYLSVYLYVNIISAKNNLIFYILLKMISLFEFNDT